MAFKKVPVEMLLEIVRFIRFHRRWAHVRVSNAFDQLMLESMTDFLKHAQALIETILKNAEKIVHRLLRSDGTTVAHLNSIVRRKCPTRR
uniref:F-box domain-containing protein n=1 Tax=Globodera rostochiensis TaxID=31243 RepID=A0A914I1U8_GLORO